MESRQARRYAHDRIIQTLDSKIYGVAQDGRMASRRRVLISDRLFTRIERLFDVKAFAQLSVMIAGCGSGGSQVAQFLAMSGLRNFVLVDNDELQIENVIRHVCGIRYIGWRKTSALADILRDRNPQVEITEIDLDLLSWKGLQETINNVDVVVVGTDSESSRYRLNEVCVETNTPFTVGRVFTRGIGGEVYAYRPARSGCLACLEGVLERTHYREGVREVDLATDEDRQKVYDLEIEEIKDSPGLSVDIGFVVAFHTRFTLDALGNVATIRPKFLTPIDENYLVWANRAVPPFSRNFQLQRMTLLPQEDCMVCGGLNELKE